MWADNVLNNTFQFYLINCELIILLVIYHNIVMENANSVEIQQRIVVKIVLF